MPDQPDLQLGSPPPGLVRRTGTSPGIRVLVCVQLVTLLAVGLLFMQTRQSTFSPAAVPEHAQKLRATALALEERGLSSAAAAAWQEFLRLSPDAGDRPEILYRTGRLLMEAEDFGSAVAVLVEAEQQVPETDSLSGKIGPRIVECLRRLGHYGEVGRELSRQVEVGSSEQNGNPVLATFAGESLTAADVDRMIENHIDRILDMQSESEFRVSREQLLQQYQSADMRQRMLQEIIQRELFSRRARELKIDQEESYRQAREFLQTELLAGRFLARELAAVQPSDVDVESFYRARQTDYRQPATATVLTLPAQADPDAETGIRQIQSAEEFRKQAEQTAGDAGLVPLRVVQGQPHPRLGETSALFDLEAGEWTSAPVEAGEEKLWILLQSKTAASIPPLSRIRARVEEDYRRIKRQEITQKLSADLMTRYQVRIHARPAAATPAGDASQDAADGSPGRTSDDQAAPPRDQAGEDQAGEDQAVEADR